MKNLLFAAFSILFIAVACSKKEPVDLYPQDGTKANYDTAAVDSFSAGATSVDVARQITISSQNYQDSVKAAIKKQTEEQRIKEELEKENKKKDAEKKKSDEEKQKTSEPSPTPQTKTE